MSIDELGDALRYLRESKGLTGDDVADLVGCVPQTVYLWELGEHYPRADKFFAWAQSLGLDIVLVDHRENPERRIYKKEWT